MQCDDLEIEVPKARLNELDTALHELGMLATCTNSRQEYLKEIQNRQVLNMLTINTRYVSNVSIGFKVRPVTPHARYKPYASAKREERSVLEDKVNDTLEDLAQLKKAKSLESIASENNSAVNFDGFTLNIPEVEIVSSCIEKLRVDE